MDAGHARPPCPEPTCRMYPCHSEKRFQCINIPTGETYWTTDEFTESSDPDNHSYGYFEPECLVVGDYVIVIHMNKIAYGKFDLSGVSLRSSVAKDLWGVSPMAVSNGLLYFQKMDATTEIDSGAANLFCFDIGGDSVEVKPSRTFRNNRPYKRNVDRSEQNDPVQSCRQANRRLVRRIHEPRTNAARGVCDGNGKGRSDAVHQGPELGRTSYPFPVEIKHAQPPLKKSGANRFSGFISDKDYSPHMIEIGSDHVRLAQSSRHSSL